MKKYKNTLLQDITSPLCKVERDWIRRPTTLFAAPFLFFICVIGGIFIGLFEVFNVVRRFVIDLW